jgi:opacity protein-like surface antigen
MTKMMVAVLALALAIAMSAVAQDTAQPSTPATASTGQPPDQNSAQPTPQPGNGQSQSQPNQAMGSRATTDTQSGQTLTGIISSDGKTFNSSGTTYSISNPNSVKAYASRPITVGYEMDTNNSIRITKVMLSKPQQ